MRDGRETEGRGDRYSEMQRSIMPELNEQFVGFRSNMYFKYTNPEDGSDYMDWCRGTVKKIINPKTRIVEIDWDKEFVNEGDKATTRQKLLVTKWNPKTAKEGAWREYLKKRTS